ncbi:sodium-coupled monocarboxylate transporter 2-like isoform X2 [Dermacentor andersoni]|uniref:sodium-coupled monocarboxylate transporter 2-like isoform X2 n=1 Tax=Dermacentor andersoni TaxID=34620 RepID=UPI0024176515|nr:sodium-coupled monocarboxylate transporter 2-like isoform X2 [Dermacentor andersoni]
MQFFLILIAPTTVVSKIIIDSFSPNSAVQSFDNHDIMRYMADYSFDMTSDETVWSCFLGSSAMSIYRVCLDQMVVQRLLASRTLKEAQRTVFTSVLLLVLLYFAGLFLGVAITIWFRGCDPALLGAISSIDQILPYYAKTYLVRVPGFVGLFLAGIISAATSTVSSTVNSQAAILYVDVIARRYKNAEKHVLWITRGTAVALGTSVTVYSMLCAHMGSVTRAFLMVYNGVTAPFVGLCLLAVLFPFVHSKGAGVSTLLMVVYQLCHITAVIRSGRRPPRMDMSLEYCHENYSQLPFTFNATRFAPQTESKDTFILFRLSYLWTSFFVIFATISIGVLVSAITGEIGFKEGKEHLSSDYAVKLWQRTGLLHRKQKRQTRPKIIEL